jgi:nitrogen regulatory protein PII
VKLVIGIVRPEKANDVLESLYRADVRGVSMSRVQGHGGELERVETYRGTTVQMGLAEKVRFEIAVSDEFVQPTVEPSARALAPVKSATARSSSCRWSRRCGSAPATPTSAP